MMGEVLRVLSPEDLPELLQLERECFPDSAWTLEGYLCEMERPFTVTLGLFRRPGPAARGRDGARAGAAGPEGGAGTDGRTGAPFPPVPLSAFALFWLLEGECHVMRLAVAPERRREGLGGRMLDAVVRLSEAKGMGRALLEVRETNGAALSLYRSAGFRVTGRRRGYYEGGRTDALTMTLSLPRGTPGGAGGVS
ncbi:MAG: GNAT family N-acetyltransferase [Deltaproteobacteria bacterium]|jgi:ribosomal-protein-alanine N-acetyltransferase|nr:GNAT family N-acetyltransferase [Deltaproteobacteria bacterium]